MTNLYDGTLADLLQNQLKHNPEVEALSYAVLQETRRIMDEAKQTRTISMIDELPEEILDVLAVELRGPYYREELPIERKREIIKNSLAWYAKAGTPAAIAEMAAAIFGSGDVVEWFDFDPNHGVGVPGEFDIETGAAIQDPETYMEEILAVIGRVKNVRSHLRQVHFLRYVHTSQTPKVLPQTYPVTPIRNTIEAEQGTAATVAAGTLAESVAIVTITNTIVAPDLPALAASLAGTFPEEYSAVTIRK